MRSVSSESRHCKALAWQALVARMLCIPSPRWIAPQLSKLVEKAPTGPNWVHEIKFDGYRMVARIDHGKVHTRPVNIIASRWGPA